MKIYITGSSGFLGSNLLKNFSLKNFDVRSISRQDLNNDININLEEKDIIIHLAGIAQDDNNFYDEKDYYSVNFILTKKLYDYFLNSKCKKFIFVSSVKAVSDDFLGLLTEDVVADPKSYYGKSKRIAEEYILNNFIPKEKCFYILRPCLIHGPGNKGNLSMLFNFISKISFWPLGSFENRRSLLSIDNFCFFINEIIECDNIPSGIYNLSDDYTVSVNDIIDIIFLVNGKKLNKLNINPKIIFWLAKIGDYIPFVINSSKLKKLTSSYIVSNNKIKKVLVKPLPLDIKSGLIKTFKSF